MTHRPASPDELRSMAAALIKALPDDGITAAAVLGLTANAVIPEIEKLVPGFAMQWMARLQSIFDSQGIAT